jgi:hypothetical protein
MIKFIIKAIESLTKELNIVDRDLKQMNKRQKCSSSNQILDDNPILLSNSTIDIKEELSSASNETIIVNDTVPNWVQSGGQVRLDFVFIKIELLNLFK